jgi:hypothetical protein
MFSSGAATDGATEAWPPRSWYIDVGEDRLGNEIAFLKTEIYLSDQKDLKAPAVRGAG